ncbi:ribonuclease E inhibitor RraB [Mumia sp. ZJ1417]|uniref:ribonuclease E inhibitor RraB n=1 Tax=unclassified Mumia TaxID=2621872 RepID=UPI00141E4D94|nr:MULTISPECIES: ribonuclease E inhibitor RraB [unclassified Mumia]QMW67230.1 ribonuclease E inhibitor RraB [Mumia sp. ZJ1417]
MALFRRRPTLPSTGNDFDDALLAELSKRSDLAHPRHWLHYVYAADESGARTVADASRDAGWHVQDVDTAADGNGWVIVAERDEAVVSPDAVREARAFFESLAASVTDGEYDGWEAST